MSQLYNIQIVKGSDYSVRLAIKNDDLTPFNLSGYTTSGYARYKYSDSYITLDLQPAIHNSYLSGFIDINVAGSGTSVLAPTYYNYDIEIYSSGGAITRVINGKMIVDAEVTY